MESVRRAAIDGHLVCASMQGFASIRVAEHSRQNRGICAPETARAVTDSSNQLRNLRARFERPVTSRGFICHRAKVLFAELTVHLCLTRNPSSCVFNCPVPKKSPATTLSEPA